MADTSVLEMEVYNLQSETKLKMLEFTAIQKSGEDEMGFIWFEVLRYGKSTGKSYNALNHNHAIRMHKQGVR